MKKVLGYIFVAFCAVFAAGCCKNVASSEDVEALRKEVAELRAEVRMLSRGPRHVRQVRETMPEKGERQSAVPRHPVSNGNHEAGTGPVRTKMTPEQRKARIEELRQRHIERKKASQERRAQRRAARTNAEGQGAVDAAPVAQGGDTPPADSVQ